MTGYVLLGMLIVWIIRAVYRSAVPRAERKAEQKKRAEGAIIVGDVGGQIISLYRPKTREYKQ